ncbi:MAG: DNA-directed RNA polymerase subunit H [Desulfurococcaceae archaeon]|jgi:DNA-directed RNA polymerase subunit H|nr:DNA-directed RNA polymerase subunit H [Desulfurococcaceae archaeon]
MRDEVNILEHELVPKHEIVPPEEARKILKELGVEPWRLPWISLNDPVVRAIGAKPGDIVRIYRKSPTAGISIVYRYVVPEVTKKS